MVNVAVSYQVADGQDLLKMWRHRVMLHGHEKSVEHNADGDGQIHKRVHDNQIDDVLDF